MNELALRAYASVYPYSIPVSPFDSHTKKDEEAYPKHPLERDNSSNHQALEQQAETALAARQASIEKTDARNDEPDEEGADHQVDVVELVARILSVHILSGAFRVAAPGLSWIVFRLYA